MNICIVNDDFKLGGVQKVSIELANAMHSFGDNVTLIDFSGENKFFYTVNNGIHKPKAIRPRGFKRKVYAKLSTIRQLINKKSIDIYKSFKEQTDDLENYLKTSDHDVVIVCQGVLTGLIPILRKSLPDIKIIAWQHNEYDIYINHYQKHFIDNYISGLKLADMVVCLTKEDKSKFELLNPKSTYIYNPITIENKNKKLSSLENKNIIFVGRLFYKQKGLDFILDIAENLKSEWTISIAGDGKDKNTFIKEIEKRNLNHKINLLGSLKHSQLEKLYLSGSIFISPSRWEGFGLVLTEAMSFGLPVVSFKNSGPKEILDHGKYGILVEKNNINEFKYELNKLIEDISLRKIYQQKGQIRTEDFKMKTILNKWYIVLKSLK